MLITFNWPWALLALIAVALAAAWALYRPVRQLAVVGSLELWRQSLEELDKSHKHRSMRISAAWVMLLTGACLAALALAGPAWHWQRPGRQIAICVYPSAELSPPGAKEIHSATTALLDRLSPSDRVQVVLPDVLGGASGFVPPHRAAELITAAPVLPTPADKLMLPAADVAAQHVYHFTTQPALIAQGPNITVIPLAASLPPVTFEALGAELLDSTKLQVFCSLRNNTDQARSVSVRPVYLGMDAEPRPASPWPAVQVPPYERQDVVSNLPAAPAIELSLIGEDGQAAGAGGRAFISREEVIKAKVALIGDDEPMIRRFIRVHPGLELLAQPQMADFVIADGHSAAISEIDKPALIINPHIAPPGYLAGRRYENVSLSTAVAVNDGVLKAVDMAGVAVRDLPTWQRSDATYAQTLMSYDGQAVVVAVPASAERPKTIYVSFDLSGGNTNFPLSPAFVTFLANATADLAGRSNLQQRYLWRGPIDALISRDAASIARAEHWPSSPWPDPGIYQSPSGQYQAVSLLGLHSEPPSTSATSAKSVALPPQLPAAGSQELWPLLVILAGTCWLAGWLMRERA